MSLPVGLMPPDTVSFHLLNWKTLKSNLILVVMPGGSQWAAETPCMKWERASVPAERITALVGTELQSIFSWMGSSEAAAPSLSSVRGQRWELTCWLLGFQLCSTLDTTCQIKSVASFGNERQGLGPERKEAIETLRKVNHLSALYILLSK